jgi:predicted nucleotidyltransferase
MLENSVWRQYHSENNFRQKLADFYKQGVEFIIADDKALYNVLKAKLTKKELKLFAMDTAELGDEAIKTAFSCNDEELDIAKKKLYKKMIQDKVRLSFRPTAEFLVD